MASQWFRFAYNRTVTQDDSCTVEQLNDVFRVIELQRPGSLLLALTQTNAFLYRRAVELQPATGGAQ